MKPNDKTNAPKNILLESFLKKHKLSVGVVQDMSDNTFKMAIIFNTADKKTGLDDMTEEKIKDFLSSIIDDRRY